MGLTMPRNYPGHSLPGESREMCAYCGFTYYRRLSNMRRDASGKLTCEDCDDGGKDAVTLDRENAAGAAIPSRRPPPGDW